MGRLFTAEPVIVAIKVRRITWIAAAYRCSPGGTSGRTIREVGGPAEGALRLHRWRTGPTVAMSAPVFAIIVAAIGSEPAGMGGERWPASSTMSPKNVFFIAPPPVT